MRKNKIILILLIIASVIAGGTYYYSSQKISSSNTDIIETDNNDEFKNTDGSESEEVINYDTKNLNKYINNNEIVSIQLGVSGSDYMLTKETEDQNKIQCVVDYLRNLEVVKKEERAPSDTPEQ